VRKTNVSIMAMAALVVGLITVPAQAASAAPAAQVAAPVAAAVSVSVPLAPVTGFAAKKKAAKKKTVALTFDDGPSDYTYRVLDVLKKYKIKGTFCIVGNNVKSYPKTMLRIQKEGHRLCNHSRDHADLTKLSTANAKKELTDCQGQIKAATKVAPKVVRFPYGASNAKVRKVAKDLKLRSLGWDVDPLDWKNPPPKTITARILKATTPGDVVLMHDGGGDRSHTVSSLPGTIAKLKKKGYTFVLA
jgi:peptidoglycan/xylan/chitin deacetylase (PgdA/CDA1 family)